MTSSFEQEYREKFLDFITEQGEAPLAHAYELGRRAMADGLGVNDIATVHWSVVDDVRSVGDIDRRNEQSLEFLTEALAPYELMLRGFKDTVAELRQLNQTLERRVAEQTAEAERARDEALAASNAKSEFLAMMSHELRTPLNAIIGYADLLLMGTPMPLPEESIEQVSRIVANARHLVDIVEQVLGFARMEADKESVNLERADLRDLTRNTAALVEPLAKQKGLRFRVRVPRAPAPLLTDEGKVRQILLNLLSNAVKFTDRGHVVLCACVQAGSAVMTVKDTGVGIAAKDRDRIFEPFLRATERDVEGTGLGLSVSRRLARLLGGDLTLVPSTRKGTRFDVRIPVHPRQTRQA